MTVLKNTECKDNYKWIETEAEIEVNVGVEQNKVSMGVIGLPAVFITQ